MNAQVLQKEDETLLFPVEFLNGLDNPPPVVQFLTRENRFVQEEIVNDVRFVEHLGQYLVKEGSSYKFQIATNKNSKLAFILAVIISQIRNELQFGDVLSYPAVGENFERMVLAVMSEDNVHQFVNKLSRYSSELVKRSIHACGVGIALALFLGYEEDSVKAIGLGGFLHEYGYLVDPVKHATAGARSLGMAFFKNQGKYTAIVLNIIEWHHAMRPHKTPQVNCGKIAIHWCSQGNLDARQRMRAIETRRFLYSEEIFSGFVRLFDLMVARKAN